MTAFPTTALVPKLAVFCNCLRNLDGMSDPSFFPEITLFTHSGVVNLPTPRVGKLPLFAKGPRVFSP